MLALFHIEQADFVGKPCRDPHHRPRITGSPVVQFRSLFGSIGIAAVCLPTLFAEGPPASYDLRKDSPVNGTSSTVFRPMSDS